MIVLFFALVAVYLGGMIFSPGHRRDAFKPDYSFVEVLFLVALCGVSNQISDSSLTTLPKVGLSVALIFFGSFGLVASMNARRRFWKVERAQTPKPSSDQAE